MRLIDINFYDTRANQPAANTVPVGTYYAVSDEDGIIERSNGTTWDSVGGGAGGAADVVVSTITLSESDLEGLGTTAKEIVPAGGSNTLIQPIMFTFKLVITTGYSSTPSVNIYYGTNTTGLLITDMTFSWNLTNTYIKSFGMGQILHSTGTFDPRNKAINIKANGDPSNPGTGVATAVASLTYQIFSL